MVEALHRKQLMLNWAHKRLLHRPTWCLETGILNLVAALICMNISKHFCLRCLTHTLELGSGCGSWLHMQATSPVLLWSSCRVWYCWPGLLWQVIGGTSRSQWLLRWRRKRNWFIVVSLDSLWGSGPKLGVLLWWLCGHSLHYNILHQNRDGSFVLLWGVKPSSLSPWRLLLGGW